MALIRCPECGRQVSDQAMACPECGYPIRKTEYKSITVSYSTRYGNYGGKNEYEVLLKEGWHVIDERMEDLINDDGELYGWLTHYELER